MYWIDKGTDIIIVESNKNRILLYAFDYNVIATFDSLSDQALNTFFEYKKTHNVVLVCSEQFVPHNSFCDLVYGFDWVYDCHIGDLYEIDFSLFDRYLFSEQKCYLDRIVRTVNSKTTLAIIHGNCQTDNIRKMLLTNKLFHQQYTFVKTFRVHVERCAENFDYLDRINVLSKVRMFITQPIKSSNKFGTKLSSEELIKKMHKDCIAVLIPNIYFNGYFPQYRFIRNDGSVPQTNLYNSCDVFLDSLISQGYDIEKTISILSNEKLIPLSVIQSASEKSINILEEREKNDNTIVISDIIKANYRASILFRAVNHPEQSLMAVVAKRLLTHIGITDNVVLYDNIDALRGSDTIIYPCIKQLVTEDGAIDNLLYFPARLLYDYQWSFEQYVRYYFDFYKNKILDNEKRIHSQLFIDGETNDLAVKVSWSSIDEATKYRIQKIDYSGNATESVWKTIYFENNLDEKQLFLIDKKIMNYETYAYRLIFYDALDIMHIVTGESIINCNPNFIYAEESK